MDGHVVLFRLCLTIGYLFLTAAVMIMMATRPEAMDPIQIQRLLLLTEALADTIPDLSVSKSRLSPSAVLLQLLKP